MLVHLCLGDTFRGSLSMMLMDLHSGTAMVLGSGWDWISSHDLTHIYQQGMVQARTGAAQWQAAAAELLPAPTRLPRAADLGVLIEHAEFKHMLRQTVREEGGDISQPPPLSSLPVLTTSGWSKQLLDDHAELAAQEAETCRRASI